MSGPAEPRSSVTAAAKQSPSTDDERWITVNGRRWRRSDPAIPTALGTELVKELMAADR